MYLYRAYGQEISSHIPLPELLPGGTGGDLVIRSGPLDRPAAPGEQLRPGCWRIAPSRVDYYWPTVAALSIRDGREIVVDADPEADEDTLRLTLLGPALGTALHQKGLLVLHASVVEVRGGAVGILGGSGWGKSTTAGALCALGHRLCSDDMLVIDPVPGEIPRAFPGFPQLKLWPNAAESLGHSPDQLTPLSPRYEKLAQRRVAEFTGAPLPLRHIYVLEGAAREACRLEALPGRLAVLELLQHSFCGEVLVVQDQERNLRQCAEVVRRTRVSRLVRTSSLADLRTIARLIERDVLQDESDRRGAA